jgi:hypothetical protein
VAFEGSTGAAGPCFLLLSVRALNPLSPRLARATSLAASDVRLRRQLSATGWSQLLVSKKGGVAGEPEYPEKRRAHPPRVTRVGSGLAREELGQDLPDTLGLLTRDPVRAGPEFEEFPVVEEREARAS